MAVVRANECGTIPKNDWYALKIMVMLLANGWHTSVRLQPKKPHMALILANVSEEI